VQRIDKRVHTPDGRHIKPDYLLDQTVVEFDGWYYHHKTEALSTLGYTVIRFRDELPDIAGATNYSVHASGSLEDLVAQVFAHLDSEFTRAAWLRVCSRRASHSFAQSPTINEI
jgi:hypothetical protein